MVWHGMIRYDTLFGMGRRADVLINGMVWHGMVRYGMLCHGIALRIRPINDMVWEWYDMVFIS